MGFKYDAEPVRDKVFARVAIDGPAKSGKTYTALRIARGLVGPEGKILVGDSEARAARKYLDQFQFAHGDITDCNPLRYIEVIEQAVKDKFGVVILDSLSHSWMGVGGTLEQVEAKKKIVKNDFMAWAEPSSDHRKLLERILGAQIHVIATLRSKMSYEIVDQGGRKVPVKIGLQPVHREGVEYEFDVLASMDVESVMRVHGSRCRDLRGMVVKEPDERVGQILRAWCDGRSETPGEMPRSFEIGGKMYHTAGITKESLEVLWKFKRTHAARVAEELAQCGVENLEDLTEAQAVVMKGVLAA